MVPNKEAILKLALKDVEPVTVKEVIKSTSIKYIGSTSVDIDIYTQKWLAERVIKLNIVNIKQAIYEIDGKTVRNIHINNNRADMNIKELESKENLESVKLGNMQKTNEVSGENNMVDNKTTFVYEKSVLNKKVIDIELYNVKTNKTFTEEINSSIFTNGIFLFKRVQFKSKIKNLLEHNYQPNNNDTKEVIELLSLS